MFVILSINEALFALEQVPKVSSTHGVAIKETQLALDSLLAEGSLAPEKLARIVDTYRRDGVCVVCDVIDAAMLTHSPPSEALF